MPLGLDANGNPRVFHYRFILLLPANTAFFSFEISNGTIDCNSFPGDETSFLGISLQLLAPYG